jgi:putative molybdopterin biosynthesis protein
MTKPARHEVRRVAVKRWREERGLTAAELAKEAGISRQAIYAIENGSFLPNTLVALRLARALDVSVEDLFDLEGEAGAAIAVEAEWLFDRSPASVRGELVRLCGAGRKRLALPVGAAFSYLPETDGTVEKQTRHRVRISTATAVRGQNDERPEILIAGCDPALSFLADLARSQGIEVVAIPGSSRQALRWLAEEKVDVAGSHLPDDESGEFNLHAIRSAFPKGGVRAFTFAHWESGLVTKPGNPKKIFSVADLASGHIVIVNREKGSGSRAQLDAELRRAGIPASRVKGYDRVVGGHLQAAFGVAGGWADCCLATRSAARCYGLGFVPLRQDRFDLVFPEKLLKNKPGAALADLLNRSSLRQRLTNLAGYEASRSGMTIV